MSILFITHDLGLIQKFSDNITVMQKERLWNKERQNLFSNPQHPYTNKLINSEPSAKQETTSEENPFVTVKNLNIYYPLPNKNFSRKIIFML